MKFFFGSGVIGNVKKRVQTLTKKINCVPNIKQGKR